MRKLFFSIGFFSIVPFFIFLIAYLFTALAPQTNENTTLSLHVGNANAVAYAALPGNLDSVSDSVGSQDSRVEKVCTFLADVNSPLTQYCGFIVSEADTYNIDYRLLGAIAMQETTACEKEIPGTYNCWGYGIYGKNVTGFNSYEDAIDTITRYFAKKKSIGVTTLEQIGAIYNPQNKNNWQANVASFMAEE